MFTALKVSPPLVPSFSYCAPTYKSLFMRIFIIFSIFYLLCTLQFPKRFFFLYHLPLLFPEKFPPALRFWAIKTIWMAFIVPRHHELFPLSTPILSPLSSKTPFETSVSHFSYPCYAVLYIPPTHSQANQNRWKLRGMHQVLVLLMRLIYWAKTHMRSLKCLLFTLNQCTVWQLTECDDTRYCIYTIFLLKMSTSMLETCRGA